MAVEVGQKECRPLVVGHCVDSCKDTAMNVDGTEATQTVTFAVRGVEYEIDLSDAKVAAYEATCVGSAARCPSHEVLALTLGQPTLPRCQEGLI